MVFILNKKIVVFAPHPDDETFGCGGTIAKRLTECYEVIIVVMTDGKNAFTKFFNDNISSFSPNEIKQIRKAELIKAMYILGVPKENIMFLDFEDGALKNNFNDATRKILEILSDIQPVEIYFPFEKDAHRDHRAAGLILQYCVRRLTFPTCAYKYSISGKSAQITLNLLRVINFFRHNLVFVDISPFLQQKAAAINEYKSQIATVLSKQDRPVVPNCQRFLKKSEVFFRCC